jgi:hypothetical protein
VATDGPRGEPLELPPRADYDSAAAVGGEGARYGFPALLR